VVRPAPHEFLLSSTEGDFPIVFKLILLHGAQLLSSGTLTPSWARRGASIGEVKVKCEDPVFLTMTGT
jgi:hypothetical protein